MRAFVVTPPAPIVTWEQANARLRLNDDVVQQDDVQAMIAGATAHIDGPAGWLGRALGPQTIELRLDRLDSLVLPCPEIIDIVSIQYLDQDGALQTLDPSIYELAGAALDLARQQSWPATRPQREAVRIRYRAGYVVDPTADPLVAAVPAAITTAILLMVGDLYSNRESTLDARASGVGAIPMPTTVENMLAPYRVYA